MWHQCRPENLDQLKELYAAHGLQARVDTFIHNLREAYEWADLIVSRAGAGLVMEISLVGRPVIFIPLPNAQGDHQGVNASFLVDAGRALLVREGEEFVARLQAAIEQVLTLDVYQQMCQAALPERPVDAAETIAKGVLRLVDG